MRRAAILTTGNRIGAGDIKRALGTPGKSQTSDIMTRSLGDGFDIEGVLDEVKRHYLTRAMDEAGGQKKRASELWASQIPIKTLTSWMHKLGIS